MASYMRRVGASPNKIGCPPEGVAHANDSLHDSLWKSRRPKNNPQPAAPAPKRLLIPRSPAANGITPNQGKAKGQTQGLPRLRAAQEGRRQAAQGAVQVHPEEDKEVPEGMPRAQAGDVRAGGLDVDKKYSCSAGWWNDARPGPACAGSRTWIHVPSKSWLPKWMKRMPPYLLDSLLLTAGSGSRRTLSVDFPIRVQPACRGGGRPPRRVLQDSYRQAACPDHRRPQDRRRYRGRRERWRLAGARRAVRQVCAGV